MKIWNGFGSEHSYSLVLVGHFANQENADEAADAFERMRQIAAEQLPEDTWENRSNRFDESLRQALASMSIYDFGKSDVDNFWYEHSVRKDQRVLVIDTDESEIQGFIKLLLKYGARIEIYSSHEWTEDGEPLIDDPASRD